MKLLNSAFVLAALASSSAVLQADLLAPKCVANTLTFYETLNNDHEQTACSVGIENFSGFTFSKSGSGASETANDILVTPVVNSTDEGGGFTFSLENPNALNPAPQFMVAAGQSATYIIDWRFVIDPGPVGSGADLGVDPPFGNVSITQNYCLDSQIFAGEGNRCSPPIGPVQTLHVDVADPFEHLNFNPQARNFGTVDTIISLNGSDQSGPSGFDGFVSTQDVAPEPATWGVVFGCLLGITVRKMRKIVS